MVGADTFGVWSGRHARTPGCRWSLAWCLVCLLYGFVWVIGYAEASCRSLGEM